jgi:hypothetical protein
MKYLSIAKDYVLKFFALPPVVVFGAGIVIGYLIKMAVR